MLHTLMLLSFFIMGISLVILLLACAFSRDDVIKPSAIVMIASAGFIIFSVIKLKISVLAMIVPIGILWYGLSYVIGIGAGHLFGGFLSRGLYNPLDRRRVKKEHSIAKSHVKFGRYHEAIEQFQKDFAEDPKDKHILWEIATIYAYNLNEYSRAVSCLEQILIDKRKGLEDLWLLASFRAAELHMKNLDNPGRAREIMQSVAKRYPDTHHSRQAEVWLWGAGINGQFDDKYHDIKIEEDYYRSVNERLVQRWIISGEVNKLSLILNPETGKWDHLGDLGEFNTFWPERE